MVRYVPVDANAAARTKFAVDRQIEERKVTQTTFTVQEKPNRPNLFLRKKPLRADRFSCISCRSAPSCGINF